MVTIINKLKFFRENWLFCMAVGLFCCILLMHIMTIFGRDMIGLGITQFPNTVLLSLGVGTMIIGGPVIMSEVDLMKKTKIKRPWEAFAASLPLWMRFVFGVLFIYALINYAIVFVSSPGGVPRIVNGNYILDDHGITTLLNFAEYKTHVEVQVRLATSYLLVFNFVTTCYFRPKSTDSNFSSDEID